MSEIDKDNDVVLVTDGSKLLHVIVMGEMRANKTQRDY